MRILISFLIVSAMTFAAPIRQATPPHWHIQGALSEACTCSPPCSCNFGEGPSPNDYCHLICVLGIKQGDYNGVKLDGLKFAAASGGSGKVLYLDEKATVEQRPGLERIARVATRQAVGPDDLSATARKQWKAILYVPITQEVGPRGNKVSVGTVGGFKAGYIFGRDPNKPVVVENNTMLAIDRAIKGKTEYLKYKDAYGNTLDYTGTNSNQGDFDYTEKSKL
jgi:hypothetical protein